MKFRQFLLLSRAWCRLRYRLRATRRRERALMRRLHTQETEATAKLELLDQFYQKQLATERKRFEVMMTGWADRVLQKEGLIGISHLQSDLSEKVRPHLMNQPDDKQQDISALLSFDQREYFENTKRTFWAQGIEQDVPVAEIARKWEAEVKHAAFDDARNSVIG